jgi:hypothetical protein
VPQGDEKLCNGTKAIQVPYRKEEELKNTITKVEHVQKQKQHIEDELE